MRKCWIVSVVMVLMAFAAAGCGAAEEAVDAESPAGSPAASASATAGPTDKAWTTVATLKSSDPQKFEGMLISKPFKSAGTIRLKLIMPGGGKTDGVLAAIFPAAKAKDPSTILGALSDAHSVTLIPSAPSMVIQDLEGTYVLVNSVRTTEKAWAIKIDTKR